MDRPNTVEQCKAAGVACFVKQLGSNAIGKVDEDAFVVELSSKTKNGDPLMWPADLRVREFPCS